MLDYVILGFLMKNDLSGYDIKRMMSLSIANFFDASFGSIYPALNRMEQKGLIRSTEIVAGGKYKKIYQIQANGQKTFRQWLEQPIELPRENHEHLARIFFYGELPGDKAAVLIAEFIQSIQAEMNRLDELETQVKGRTDLCQIATLHYGKEFYRFLIRWCQDFLSDLKSGAKKEELK